MAYFINDKSSPIPSPTLNGGWFTGEQFAPNAQYANVYVVPCSAYWNSENLKSANPPPQALYQMQSGYRPGNNTDPQIAGVKRYNDDLNVYCTPSLPCDNPDQNIGQCGKHKRIISV